MRIYLDRDQCDHFRVPYGPPGGALLRARAETLLASRREAYDEETLELLRPLLGRTLVLEDVGFGWYELRTSR